MGEMVMAGRRIRLMPNSRQERLFRRYAGAARFAWNESLSYVHATLKSEHRHPSQKEQREHLRALHSTSHPWLADIPECVTKRAIDDLDKAYRAAYTRKKNGVIVSKKKDEETGMLVNPFGFPELHKKDPRHLSFYQRTDTIHATDASHVKLTGVATAVKTKYRHLPDRFMNPRVIYDGVFWYLSWSEACPMLEPSGSNHVIGVDAGLKSLATTSDGAVYEVPEKANPNIVRLAERKKRLQHHLSRKYEANKDASGRVHKTGNIKKLEDKIYVIDRKISNASAECRQRAVNDIIEPRPKAVVIEDLNVRGMFANKHLSKKLQRVGIGDFLARMKSSCRKRGIPVIEADRFYPSTRICSSCHALTGPHGFDGLRTRKWTCPVCGAEHDRDFNASVNLRDYPRSGFVRRRIKARGVLKGASSYGESGDCEASSKGEAVGSDGR